MYKECNVVMLPTEKAENCILVHKKVQYAVYHPGKLFTQAYLRESDAVSMHLYILSDEEIKAGDWFVTDDRDRKNQNNGIPVYSLYKCTSIFNKWIGINGNDFVGYNPDWSKKVIAASNSECNLPIISNSFIDEFVLSYNTHAPIMKVMVEYEELHSDDISNFMLGNSSEITVPKLINNSLITREIKDSWNRKEVENLCNSAIKFGYNSCFNEEGLGNIMINNWINKNL